MNVLQRDAWPTYVHRQSGRRLYSARPQACVCRRYSFLRHYAQLERPYPAALREEFASRGRW